MSDDKPTPRDGGAPEGTQDKAPEQDKPDAKRDVMKELDELAGVSAPKPSAAPPEASADDDEAKAAAKAAKIAAAKAKAAAKKAADEAPKEPWEAKPVPPAAEDAAGDEDAVALGEAIEGAVLAATRFAGDVTLTVASTSIIDVCRFLKHERGFTFLVDLTAVDWPEREEGRFDVVYWLHRFDDSKRLRLVAVVGEDELVDSVTVVWKTANWLEREVYDMFGVFFEGHPNLERILMWEGFNGHPLRKDFPVEGVDTGAAIYPDHYPSGHGPVTEEGAE